MKNETIIKLETFNVLSKYENGVSLKELSRLTGCNRNTIKSYLINNGAKVNFDINFDLDLAKKMYLEGNSCRKIAEVLNINEDRLSLILQSENIIVSNSSDYRFNKNIFDKIDTEEKAYWLGFLYADGSVGSNNKFELSLKGSDIEHLHKFNKFMEYKGDNVKTRIQKEKYPSCRWYINSKYLCDSLASKGCLQNKSLILKFPSEEIFENKDLIRHFIRGYWEGDGSIIFTDKTKEIQVLGTKDFLEGLNKYLPNTMRIKSIKNKRIYECATTTRKAFSILQYLYKDCNIYLERKYQKYLDFCHLYEKSYNKSGNIGELCDENTEITSEITQGLEVS